MEQEQTTSAQSSGLIYKLNDRPPLKETLFAALQHLLAIFVAIITPPLIIAGALELDLETTGYLGSMDADCCVFRVQASLLSVLLYQQDLPEDCLPYSVLVL